MMELGIQQLKSCIQHNLCLYGQHTEFEKLRNKKTWFYTTDDSKIHLYGEEADDIYQKDRE